MANRAQPTPQTIICRACAEPFHWSGKSRRPAYCKRVDCQRRRQAARSLEYFRRLGGWQGRTYQTASRLAPPLAAGALPTTAPPSRETPEQVEALFARVRAERLAEERRTGRRRHTIESGWQQRADAVYMEGGEG